jgi:hypothetical protein
MMEYIPCLAAIKRILSGEFGMVDSALENMQDKNNIIIKCRVLMKLQKI